MEEQIYGRLVWAPRLMIYDFVHSAQRTRRQCIYNYHSIATVSAVMGRCRGESLRDPPKECSPLPFWLGYVLHFARFQTTERRTASPSELPHWGESGS